MGRKPRSVADNSVSDTELTLETENRSAIAGSTYLGLALRYLVTKNENGTWTGVSLDVETPDFTADSDEAAANGILGNIAFVVKFAIKANFQLFYPAHRCSPTLESRWLEAMNEARDVGTEAQ